MLAQERVKLKQSGSLPSNEAFNSDEFTLIGSQLITTPTKDLISSTDSDEFIKVECQTAKTLIPKPGTISLQESIDLSYFDSIKLGAW